MDRKALREGGSGDRGMSLNAGTDRVCWRKTAKAREEPKSVQCLGAPGAEQVWAEHRVPIPFEICRCVPYMWIYTQI